MHNVEKWLNKHTLQIWPSGHHEIFKVCLTIFQNYAWSQKVAQRQKWKNKTKPQEQYAKLVQKDIQKYYFQIVALVSVHTLSEP